jgi:hypothetical protein
MAPLDLMEQEEKEKQDAQNLEAFSKDFKRLQQQKNRKTGGVESRVLTSLAFDWGEHYIASSPGGLVVEEHKPNKLYLRFNLIAPAKSKLAGRLTSLAFQFYASPDRKDPQAQSDAEVVDKLILALDEKLDQPARTWEITDWLLTGGVAFEYIPWIPNATIEASPQFDENGNLLFTHVESGEIVDEQTKEMMIQQGQPPEAFEIYEEIEMVGDVGSEVLGPLNVFVDQSVRSIEDLAPDQAVYIAKIRTRGWIEDFIGSELDVDPDKELKIVTTSLTQAGESTASLFIKDLIPMVQGERGEDDPDMYVVVERFQPTSTKNPNGRYTIFIPNKRILFDDDNPYGEIPIVDFHFHPTTTTFWSKDYITDLIPPQKFINKRISQLGEQANASIYDKILLGGPLTAKDIPTDSPGIIEKGISESGQPQVARLGGPQLPSWFMQSVDLSTKIFQQIAGGNDLFQENKFPGQMRGPMVVPMLQEILDSEWGMLYQHLGQRMAKVKQMRINRVKQFYPPLRTLHYTDHNQRDEVLSFHKDKIFKAGSNYAIKIDRGSMVPELKALNEARIKERLSSPLSILYTDDRTGRLDKSKIAADLKMGDYGREGKESQSRKFAQQLIDKLWKGQNVPPVMPFWDHEPMLDELEAEMQTTEFLEASPQIQQLFLDRWNQHSQILQQRYQAQQDSMNSTMMHAAVANATQQTAAKVAAEVTDAALHQVGAQVDRARMDPTPEQQIASASDMIRSNLQFPGRQ